MANGIISYIDRVKPATFTAGNQSAELPAANLADSRVAVPWRTAGSTDTYVEVDFGAEYSIRILMLAGTNLADSDTVRHRLSTAGGGPAAGDAHDSGAITTDIASGYTQHVYVLNSAVTARYWRMDISAPSRSSEGWFEVGRAWAGDGIQPRTNFAYGHSRQWQDQADQQIAPESGVAYVRDRYTRRVKNVAWEALTESEALDEFDELWRIAGTRNQIVLIPDPNSNRLQREAILGRASQTTPIENPTLPIYSTAITIQESK